MPDGFFNLDSKWKGDPGIHCAKEKGVMYVGRGGGHRWRIWFRPTKFAEKFVGRIPVRKTKKIAPNKVSVLLYCFEIKRKAGKNDIASGG